MDESRKRRSAPVLPPNVERFLVELYEPPRHNPSGANESVHADYRQHFCVFNPDDHAQTRDHVNYLKVWTVENVDHQLPNPKIADQLAKKFMADAEALGFSFAQFMFNEASVARYITRAMALPRD